jgi:hypothetical protein
MGTLEKQYNMTTILALIVVCFHLVAKSNGLEVNYKLIIVMDIVTLPPK